MLPPPPALITPGRTIMGEGLPWIGCGRLPVAASETLRALTCANALLASIECLLAAPRPFQSATQINDAKRSVSRRWLVISGRRATSCLCPTSRRSRASQPLRTTQR